jgi:hypothetical protein
VTIIGSATALSTEESIDAEGHQVYTSVYRVQSNDPNENPIRVREASGAPDYGDHYTWGGVSNTDAFCLGKQTQFEKEEDSRLFWLVTCTHTTKPVGRDGKSLKLRANPLSEPWKIGGSYVQGTKAVQRNKNGAPTINTAFEQITYEIPDGYDTLNLEGPTDTISLSTRAQAVLKVNSASMWGLSPRMLLLQQWQYEIMYHGSRPYVYHRLQFLIKYDLWNEKSYEMGTREYISTNPAGKQFVPIVSANDAGYSGRYFLDASGRKLSDANVVAGNFVEREDEIIPEYNFLTLGFPDPLPGPFV